MTFDELVQKIAQIMPLASFREDNEGQIIIYTNLSEKKENDNLVELPLEKWLDEDYQEN